MVKQNPAGPKKVDRRQLLTTVAAITAGGVLPTEPTGAATTPVETIVNAAAGPVSNAPALNVCPSTARRIEEIAARNRIRQEAGLPLLSIAQELRRMKAVYDAATFEQFAARYRQAVWDEVLAPVRQAKGDLYWRPRGFMEGLGYQAQVNELLRERFVGRQRLVT